MEVCVITGVGAPEKGMMMLRATAESRMGKPEELGYALATAVDERNGFLTGTDVLCDGGATMKRKYFARTSHFLWTIFKR